MQCTRAFNNYFLAAAILIGTTIANGPAGAQNVNCNGCVSAQDLAENAQPAGADFTGPTDINPLPGADTVVASITMNLPGPGMVILNSGGYAEFDDNPSSVTCSITKQTSIPSQPRVIAQNHDLSNARRMPIATTRGFRETSGGTKTYNLVCVTNVGSAEVNDVILTAIFAPRRY
jgi:hypothetical protein